MSKTNMDVILGNMSVHDVAEMLDSEGRGCKECYANGICTIECADEDCIDMLEKWLKMECEN